jgi:hypothetical protein
MLLTFRRELEAKRGFLFLAQRQHRGPAQALETGRITPKSLTYGTAIYTSFSTGCPGWSTRREFSVTIDSFETLERSCHDD